MRFRSFLLALSILLAALPSNLSAEDTCPVTTPPSPRFVPPAPYRQTPPGGTFWYGTNELWTSLPVEGGWRLSRDENGGYSNKLFLWQEGWDWRKEPYPPGPNIVVVLKRLDGDTPPATLHGGTNAFFDNSWAMLTGVTLPTEGCWEVTAFHNSDRLTFVLLVQQPQ